jgi:hypothetical protein
MVTSPARDSDIAYVFAHLWDRGITELAGLGLTVAEGAQRAKDFAGKDESYTYWANEVEPICVFGAVNGVTWFQATEKFGEFHAGVTSALREMGKKPGYVIFSQCIHPRTEAWFAKIGYKADPTWHGETVTGSKLYKFVKE